MGKKKIKKVDFRRRREGKTNYSRRMKLLKSGKPRLVIRKTNKYIIAQIVKSKEAQDFVIAYANSKELAKFGWQHGFKNVPAAYLTGFLLARKAKGKITDAILDIGLQRSTKGSRIYAAVKGAIDAGLQIKCSEKMWNEERIRGKHLKKNVEKDIEEVKKKIEARW